MYSDEAISVYLYLKDQSSRTPTEEDALKRAWREICFMATRAIEDAPAVTNGEG